MSKQWIGIASSLVLVTGACAVSVGEAPEASNLDFSRTTIDIGVVVRDVKKAVAFYQNGLGFTEIDGFHVPAEMGADAGLSDNRPFDVRVMVLGKGPTATKVKLMAFPDAPGVKPSNDFIHTTLGLSYLTLWVTDVDTAVSRARQAGAKVLAKGPFALPPRGDLRLYLAVVRDPDGNMIELVGPKRNEK